MISQKEQARVLKQWIPKLKKKMFLEDWDIRIRWEPNKDYHAVCDSDWNYRIAYLIFSPEERTREKLFEILVHEMCHVQHGMDEVIGTNLDVLLCEQQCTIIDNLFTTCHEDLVRRLEHTYLKTCKWYDDFE